MWFLIAAKCSAVRFKFENASTEAPLVINILADSRSPLYEAWWSAVHPLESRMSRSALQSTMMVVKVFCLSAMEDDRTDL